MSYKTVKKLCSETIIIKKSKFIGYISPVSSVDQAEAFIKKIKNIHWDATHNVYAYIIRDGNRKRYSDDGEPQGTAGFPILNVIEKEDLFDVCIVVTRYFGGTMLGAGGLVRAYTNVAVCTIGSSELIVFDICDVLKINLEYSLYGSISSLLEKYNCHIESSDFNEKVDIIIYVNNKVTKFFIKDVNKISNGEINPIFIKKIYWALK